MTSTTARWRRERGAARAYDAGGVSIGDVSYAAHHRGEAHHHEGSYLSLILEGTYRGFCGDRTRQGSPGDVLLYARHHPHASDTGETPTRVAYLELPRWSRRNDRWQTLLALSASPARAGETTSIELRRLLLRMLGGAPATAVAAAARRVVARAEQDARRAPSAPSWIGPVQRRLYDSCLARVYLADVAEVFDLSVTNMARSFHKHVGCTIGEYVRRCRVSRAAASLSSVDRTIAAVAADHGFSDQSHMGRHFRQQLGLTPRTYRSLLRREPVADRHDVNDD